MRGSSAKIGKILGIDAMVVGSITQFGQETKETKIGGAGGGIGGFGKKKSKAIVSVDARLIDVDTAEILAVADGKGESKREGTSLLGGGGNWRGFGAGGVDFSSSNFEETILGEAVKAAVEQLSSNMIKEKEKVKAHVPQSLEGVVAAVEGDIIINIGGKTGIKVGDALSVERVTQEIKNPTTGQILRKMSTRIAVIRLVALLTPAVPIPINPAASNRAAVELRPLIAPPTVNARPESSTRSDGEFVHGASHWARNRECAFWPRGPLCGCRRQRRKDHCRGHESRHFLF